MRIQLRIPRNDGLGSPESLRLQSSSLLAIAGGNAAAILLVSIPGE